MKSIEEIQAIRAAGAGEGALFAPEPSSPTNPYVYVQKAQRLHNSIVRSQEGKMRRLREDELALLKQSHKEMQKAHEHNAWYSLIGIVGAIIKTFAASFEPNDSVGKVLNSFGSGLESSQTFLRSWNEGHVNAIHGNIEIIRSHLSEIDSQNQDLHALLRDMNTVSEALKNEVMRRNEAAIQGR